LFENSVLKIEVSTEYANPPTNTVTSITDIYITYNHPAYGFNRYLHFSNTSNPGDSTSINGVTVVGTPTNPVITFDMLP
jgi:hypothetical protein